MNNSFWSQIFAEEPEQPIGADAVIHVNPNRCPQNHPCPSVRVCPSEALTQVRYSAPTVEMDKCIQCGKCVRYCALGAISMH